MPKSERETAIDRKLRQKANQGKTYEFIRSYTLTWVFIGACIGGVIGWVVGSLILGR